MILPYHFSTPAIYGRFVNCPYTCQTLAGLSTHFSVDKPARPQQVYGQSQYLLDLCRFMDSFRSTEHFFLALSQTCRPLQVYGQFSVYRDFLSMDVYSNLQDLCRCMDTFRSETQTCRTSAGLWTLFGVPLLMFTNLQTFAGLWTLFGVQKN